MELKVKKYLFMNIFLLLTACRGGGGWSVIAGDDSIIGSWSFIYASSQCEKTLTFSNSTFFGTSLTEEYSGTWYEGTEGTSRTQLFMTVTQDNQLADCDGVADDDSGQVIEYFYLINSNDELELYANATGSTPIMVMVPSL